MGIGGEAEYPCLPEETAYEQEALEAEVAAAEAEVLLRCRKRWATPR